MEEYKCIKCENLFLRYINRTRIEPKFCSIKCYRSSPREKLTINKISEKIKFERLVKSFERHVIRKIGCWDWLGVLTKFGYPKIGSRYFNLWTGHRASWFIFNGEIPKGKCVLHRCDNPKCTNPEHLFLGTEKENIKDRCKKDRSAIGSKGGNSKLDEYKVKEIKNLLKKGISQDSIAKKFDIHQTQISKIKLEKTWRHVKC